VEVAEASLYKRHGSGQEPIGFSTINTSLQRLSAKEIPAIAKDPTIKERGSRTPYFSPTVSRDEMAVRILGHVSRPLLGRTICAQLRLLECPDRVAVGSDERESPSRLRRAPEEAVGE
jgi:hypothetical protein